MRRWGKIILGAVTRWMHADGFGLAAAMSFYMLFSSAPLIVFALLIAGLFLGEQSARQAAVDWLEGFMARKEAQGLIDMIRPDAFEQQGWLLALISGFTLLWAATLIFVRLRISVNALFKVQSRDVKQAVRRSLWGRLNALLFTVCAGLIFVAGILLTSAAPKIITMVLPHDTAWTRLAVDAGNAVVLFLAVAAIMKILAVRTPTWKATLIGSGFVLAAFELGRVLVNLYLGRSEIASAYGAANTLVVFLLWIYYSAQMLLFGVSIAGEIDGAGDEDDSD